jgi:hypothetical protein
MVVMLLCRDTVAHHRDSSAMTGFRPTARMKDSADSGAWSAQQQLDDMAQCLHIKCT